MRVWLDRDLRPFIDAVIRDTQREMDALREVGRDTEQMPPADLLAISGGGRWRIHGGHSLRVDCSRRWLPSRDRGTPMAQRATNPIGAITCSNPA